MKLIHFNYITNQDLNQENQNIHGGGITNIIIKTHLLSKQNGMK